MATGWRTDRPPDVSWKAPPGMAREARAAEQDAAAGSHEARIVPIGPGTAGTASIALRMPQPGRRLYSYLRWNATGRTVERYVGQVSGHTRSELLRDGWRQVHERDLMPRTPEEANTPNSWASTPASRAVMQANPRKDTKPERQLRSLLHGMGLRYRIDQRPIPDVRTRADLVFSRARVAVFVDGCFWHGCPDHFRPAKKNAEFWAAKLRANQARDRASDAALVDNGWHVLRVWEHEDLTTAASRIANQVRARSLER